jgi:hypothetical protein
VINALIEQAHTLPRELYKSLTWDRGKEMADHKRFTVFHDIPVIDEISVSEGSYLTIDGLLNRGFLKWEASY